MNTHHTSLQAITRYTILAISCAVFLALIVTLLKLCHKKQNESTSIDHGSSGPIASSSSTDKVKDSSILHQQADFHPITELENVTDGFHPSRIIGSGFLGTVYIATSPIGILIAVKRIHPHHVLSNPGISFFASRMRCLSLDSHPNIVPILGYAEAPGRG
ncbi:hypothetical protein HPP92_007964 [Vanilla planifolia]|uniref:Protein kinase domain-containing protein n=1 Tax=Vanilla planifolia TaxID=51239 RepID=A0A835RLJ2_VANPL|nr:hypothetical protein HPP92_007964 [Vanilla planifolia]